MIYWMSPPIAASNLAQRDLLELPAGHPARWYAVPVQADLLHRRTRRGADATTVLTVLLRAVVLVAVFLARTLFTLIQYHWSRSASATTTKRQHRLDGDAGLARPVRSRGGFPASLAFFSLIALALGPMRTWSSPPSAALSLVGDAARAYARVKNSSIKPRYLLRPTFFSHPATWPQPTRPRGLPWAP